MGAGTGTSVKDWGGEADLAVVAVAAVSAGVGAAVAVGFACVFAATAFSVSVKADTAGFAAAGLAPEETAAGLAATVLATSLVDLSGSDVGAGAGMGNGAGSAAGGGLPTTAGATTTSRLAAAAAASSAAALGGPPSFSANPAASTAATPAHANSRPLLRLAGVFAIGGAVGAAGGLPASAGAETIVPGCVPTWVSSPAGAGTGSEGASAVMVLPSVVLALFGWVPEASPDSWLVNR